jgi:hypothetical protein
MEAKCSSEISRDFQRTTWRYNPEDKTPQDSDFQALQKPGSEQGQVKVRMGYEDITKMHFKEIILLGFYVCGWSRLKIVSSSRLAYMLVTLNRWTACDRHLTATGRTISVTLHLFCSFGLRSIERVTYFTLKHNFCFWYSFLLEPE